VCVCVCLSVLIYILHARLCADMGGQTVSVRKSAERERDRERQRETERDREREEQTNRKGGGGERESACMEDKGSQEGRRAVRVQCLGV
jgi:hypothetical protein